jgi:hypothetical protein
MRRWSFAAAFLGVACGVGGCWDSSPVLLPTGAATPCLSQADAAACEQSACLQLPPNKQQISGMCSAPCNLDTDCAPHERCVTVATTDGSQSSACIRACATDADCYDDFVCVTQAGTANHLCFVTPG